MSRPDYIENAFLAIYYGGGFEDVIHQFARRWGSLTVETFQHVLKVGEGEDKLIALFAIGYTKTEEARGLLLSFLHSTDEKERWASALCLGEMKDEEAFPVLIEMLQEGVTYIGPPSEGYRGWPGDEGWFEVHQLSVARLLGEWGRLEIVPVLRQTLIKSIALGQLGVHPADDWQFTYQRALAEALGRLDAFGSFTGLDLPSRTLRVLMLHLVYGHILAHTNGQLRNLQVVLDDDLELQEAIWTVVEQRFGFLPGERIDTLCSTGKELLTYSGVKHLTREDVERRLQEVGSSYKLSLQNEDAQFSNLKALDLRGADLSGMNLNGADLIGADLRGANLTGARLGGVDFAEANLSGANLSRTDLTSANFMGAKLSGTNLTNASFFDINLIGVDLSELI